MLFCRSGLSLFYADNSGYGQKDGPGRARLGNPRDKYFGIFGDLVPKVAHSSKNHGQSQPIGSFYDLGIAKGTAGLNDGRGADFRNFFDPVGEGEERVGGCDGALSRQNGVHVTDAAGIDAAHLPGADPDALAVARIDDGAGFYMLGDLPGEKQGAHFFGRGLALGDDSQVGWLQWAGVIVLQEDSAGDILQHPLLRDVFDFD